MEEFLRRIGLMKIVFCSPCYDDHVACAVDTLNKEFQKLNNGEISDDDTPNENDEYNDGHSRATIFDDKSEEVDTEEDTINRSVQQPFGTYFKMQLSKIKLCTGAGPGLKKKPNPYSCPKYFQYIEKNWLPTMPFWTALFLGKSGQLQLARKELNMHEKLYACERFLKF